MHTTTALFTLALALTAPTAPTADLTLTARYDDTVLTAHLTCHPHGGTHPHPHRACQALNDAEADLYQIDPLHAACNGRHTPVRARVHGTWNGYPLDQSRTYTSPCHTWRDSGGLFDFLRH